MVSADAALNQIRDEIGGMKRELNKSKENNPIKEKHPIEFVIFGSLGKIIIWALFLTIAYFGFVYFQTGSKYLIELFTTNNSTLNVASWKVVANSIYITLALIILIIIDPLLEKEKKQLYIIRTILLVVVIVIGFQIYYYAQGDPYTIEKTNKLTEDSKNGFAEILKTVSCAFSVTCQEAKLHESEAKTTERIEYSIDLNENNQVYGLTDLEKKIELPYLVQSGNQMKLLKLECYHTKKSEDTLFDSKNFTDIYINTDGVKDVNIEDLTGEDISCQNASGIPLKAQREQNIPIFAVLTFEIQTSITQQIPAINHQTLPESEKKLSYVKIKNQYQTKIDEFTSSTQSNDAIKFSNTYLVNRLPLLIGDGEPREITFVFKAEKNNANNFGKYIYGKVTDIRLPDTLSFISNIEDTEQTEFREIVIEGLTNDDIFEKALTVVENEQTNLQEDIAVQNLRFEVTSTFEKKDLYTINLILEDSEIEEIKAKLAEEEAKQKALEEGNQVSSEILEKLGTPDAQGVYTYDDGLLVSELYYRYTGSSWEWSPDKGNWMGVYTTTVEGGSFDGKSPSSGNIQIIEQLNAANPNPNETQTTETTIDETTQTNETLS